MSVIVSSKSIVKGAIPVANATARVRRPARRHAAAAVAGTAIEPAVADATNELPVADATNESAVADATNEPLVLKILIVEPEPEDGAAVENIVRHVARFEPHITRVTTLRAARFALAADVFAAVIVNCDVDGEAGLDLLAATTVTVPATVSGAVAEGCRPVFIAVADKASAALRAEAHARGAVACMSKSGLSPRRIEAAILR